MNIIKKTGLFIFIVGLVVFTSSTFLGSYHPTTDIIENTLSEQQFENIGEKLTENIGNRLFSTPIQITTAFAKIYETKNTELKAAQEWDKVMWDKPNDIAFKITQASAIGRFIDQSWLMFFLTFGLCIIGALMYILPDVILLGPAGIKNNNIFQNAPN